jgi:hypothetical protein
MGFFFNDDPDLTSRPAPNESPDLSTTFADTFQAAWNRNQHRFSKSRDNYTIYNQEGP